MKQDKNISPKSMIRDIIASAVPAAECRARL